MATNNNDHHQVQNHGLEKANSVIVIMVPFPLHSHMNQVLQLSFLISSYNIPVHYAGFSIHNSQLRTRAHDHSLSPDFSKIQFHDFPIPPFVPGPNSNSSGLFAMPYIHATEHLRQPVDHLLHELSPKAKRIIIIYDALTSSVVQDATSIANAESYTFQPTTAFSILCRFRSTESAGKFLLPIPKEAEKFHDPIEIPSLEGTFSNEFANFIAYQYQFIQSTAGSLYNACRLVDGIFIDLVAKKLNKMVWALGPLHQITASKSRKYSINGKDKCLLDWLDKQEPNSVLYISFGTTISMADHDQQLKELALGLELSETKFIWAFRQADEGDHGLAKGCELPEVFEERMRAKGIGMVVSDWAPQLEILKHKSTGGFLSHHGWNSCLESISYGVPIATWPMHTDQPTNALLITQLLKVGLNVREWERRHELVSSSTINKALRRLMGSDEGAEMRQKLKTWVPKFEMLLMMEEFLYRLECDSFIAHITRQT